MSPIATIAVAQLALAREILRTEPASRDPRYLWASRFCMENERQVLASLRDPRDRTAKATETIRERASRHRTEALALKREGMTAIDVGIVIADDEGRSKGYDESTVRGWFRTGKPSR